MESASASAFEDPVLQRDYDHELQRALARLQEDEREALLLTAWDGLTAEEAGRVLGCSRRTVFSKINSARIKLGAFLEQQNCTVAAPPDRRKHGDR